MADTKLLVAPRRRNCFKLVGITPDRVQLRCPVEPARGDQAGSSFLSLLHLLLLLFKLPESAPLVRFHRLQPSNPERIGCHVHGPFMPLVAVIHTYPRDGPGRPHVHAGRQADDGGRARDPPSTADERAALSVWQTISSHSFRTPPIWKDLRWHNTTYVAGLDKSRAVEVQYR